MLCHGPVRAPQHAKPGKAVVRVALPEGSGYRSFATDLPVVIQ